MMPKDELARRFPLVVVLPYDYTPSGVESTVAAQRRDTLRRVAAPTPNPMARG